MSAIHAMKMEKLNLQKRQQLTEEFRLGLLTIEEFRTAVAKLEKKDDNSNQEQGEKRGGSPAWDIEGENGALPLFVEDL
jgi:hypothetical protein